MQTLKTALVVTFLLVVLYGAYVTLNHPEHTADLHPLGNSADWAGPDQASVDEAPAFASDLGEPSSAPPEFSSAGSNFPLPAFDGNNTGSTDTATAETHGPYTRDVSAPPLAADNPYQPAEDHETDDLDERAVAGGPSPGGYGGGRFPSPAAGRAENYPTEETPAAGDEYDSSPFANARRESVSADDFATDQPDPFADDDPASGYRPNAAESPPADEDEVASRTALAQYNFREAWAEAQRHLDDNKFALALLTLTDIYREGDLDTESRQQLLDMLDRLAGTVIYSTEHRLEPPYEVARGETLDQIADQFQVPSVLLYNINRSSINEPDLLLPGTQLKVMRGPFRAEIEVDAGDPSRGEATLFLGRLYAGRFAVSFGEDMPTPGRTYQITERLEGKPYYQPSGPPIEARSPTNPYGLHWLGFNDAAVGIHGLSRHGGEEDRRGSIRLNERDAADVYGILSVGSTVKILQ